MEERELKASFAKSGSGSLNSRVIVPITWFRKIGVTPEERDIKIRIDEKKGQIIIEKNNEKITIQYCIRLRNLFSIV